MKIFYTAVIAALLSPASAIKLSSQSVLDQRTHTHSNVHSSHKGTQSAHNRAYLQKFDDSQDKKLFSEIDNELV